MDSTFPSRAWRWPALRWRWASAALAFFLLNALRMAWVVLLDHRASGARTYWMEPFVWELTSAVLVWALIPLAQMAAFNAPWPPERWRRFLGLHLAGAGLFWVIHVAGMWTSRTLIYRWAGWGPYDYGDIWYRAPMEGGKDLLGFALLAFCFHAWEARRASQARELRAARLETELREARLQALSAQLDPHFLFNALNTLSSVIYEDVARADGLISDLGLMLRDNLQADGPTWPLRRELEHLEHYLAFVRARFGDRVRVEVEADPEVGGVQVPRFALQRLVENALKHNEAEAGRALSIRISARPDGDAIGLRVADDGVGFAGAEPPGLGLENLRRSLGLLHGGRASMQVGNGARGGAEVVLKLPVEGERG